jgi:hypothetical protein
MFKLACIISVKLLHINFSIYLENGTFPLNKENATHCRFNLLKICENTEISHKLSDKLTYVRDFKDFLDLI